MTLDEGALGKANLFDLGHRTLRFTPAPGGYRAESVTWQWDADFGAQMAGAQATLKGFAFPFSGQSWNAFSVGVTGSIVFGQPASEGGRGGRGGGISVDRFAELQQAAQTLVNTVPAISVFFKPRMSGTRYFKELGDRAVVTWTLTEPYGGVQDMSWTPTVNRFQAVLRKDGAIEMSYDQVAARDAIVGIYPLVAAGKERALGAIAGAPGGRLASVKLSSVDGLFLKAALEMQEALPAESDPAFSSAVYRICIDRTRPSGGCSSNSMAGIGAGGIVWTVQAGRGGRGGRAAGVGMRYFASGDGVSPAVKTEANTLSVEGTLPAGYKSGERVYVSATVESQGSVIARADPQEVTFSELPAPPFTCRRLQQRMDRTRSSTRLFII